VPHGFFNLEQNSVVRVLLAEDDDSTSQVLQILLRDRGYDVVAAKNGIEAWKVLSRDDAPSLAILDWEMPGMDGAEVCRKVRGSSTRNVYILMLTVKGDSEDVVAGMDAGADDYIRKPAEVGELCARLRAGQRIIAQQEKLRAQATYDHLTGVLNRGAILEMLERELARADRESLSVATIVVDVDGFKQVNDQYGHATGDLVLREVATRLSVPLRRQDAIGRYGGEEFLIVLSGCEHQVALIVSERVRCSVGSTPVRTTAGDLQITISAGLAVRRSGRAVNAHALINDADQALYRAKLGGRNRVEGSPETRVRNGLL
jgi:diguanylate cyclase (GGDEF)-like protein